MRRTLVPILAVFLVSAAGCARYEYDLIEPGDLAQHIGTKDDVVFRTDAAEYRLRTVSNRLVMRIYNDADEPLTLAGNRSFVVDPGGQSHPLVAQTIAPGSYIRLIFPPPPPTVEQTGPSFHFGVGGAYRYGYYRPYYRNYRDRGARYARGGARYGRYAYYDPFFYNTYYGPRYYRVYDDSNPAYWDWSGEGQVRVTLMYERGEGQRVEDTFVFARKKM
jgi:hypothetical protein